jgi:hypothetical protein
MRRRPTPGQVMRRHLSAQRGGTVAKAKEQAPVFGDEAIQITCRQTSALTSIAACLGGIQLRHGVVPSAPAAGRRGAADEAQQPFQAHTLKILGCGGRALGCSYIVADVQPDGCGCVQVRHALP